MAEESIPQAGASAFAGVVVLADSDPATALKALEEWSAPEHVDAIADEGVLGQSVIGTAMVEVARGQTGVCESGDNGGIPLERYVHAFWPQSGPQPWCAFFVSWCYLQVTGRKPPWNNPGLVASVEGWAQSNGRIVQQPLHGDMFGVGGQHMGLVVGADASKRVIWTVEGNTSSGCVKGNLRPWSGLWFARI